MSLPQGTFDKVGGIIAATLSPLGQAWGGEEVVNGISWDMARNAIQDGPTTKTHRAPNFTSARWGTLVNKTHIGVLSSVRGSD